MKQIKKPIFRHLDLFYQSSYLTRPNLRPDMNQNVPYHNYFGLKVLDMEGNILAIFGPDSKCGNNSTA